MSKESAKLMMMNEEERAIYMAQKMGRPLEIKILKGDLKGEKGDPGKDSTVPGPKGEDGYTPVKGKDYFDGEKGDSVMGPKGPKGEKGDIGPKGDKGNPGEDAKVEDVLKALKDPKSKYRLEPKDIKGMPINMNDMRWHGGGLSKVSHDATLTGDGTPSNPLAALSTVTKFTDLSDVPHSYTGQSGKVVVVKNTEDGLEFDAVGVIDDHKVFISATDTTAGYLLSKLVAGTGITLTKENAGGNEDIKIDWSGSSMVYPGAGIAKSTGSAWSTSITGTSSQFVKADGSLDSSTYLTSLSGAVLTDQTVGQTIGATGARLTKLWATDITVTNAITGSITGNAGGTAAGLAAQYIDWSASSGGNSIANKPTLGTFSGVNYPTWSSGTPFIKMTAAGTFALDTNTYLTSVGTGVANEITYWSGTNTLGSLATATYPSLTELSYVKGVTSGIQAQLNAKGAGTVTSVASGNGMNFTTITGTGTVTMGTPSSITSTSTNATTSTSHTHAIDSTILTTGSTYASTVSNSDGTLTISPTSGSVVASLALGHANTWTGVQTLKGTILTAGTTTAGTAPLYFTSGTNLTAAAAGAMEFTTDDLRFTITTGTARKTVALTDSATALTTGQMLFTTTNGRLTAGTGATYTAATGLQIIAGATTAVPVIAKGASSQTADLIQAQDTSANVLSKIDVNGSGFFSGTGQSIIQTGMVINQSQDNTSNGVFVVKDSNGNTLLGGTGVTNTAQLGLVDTYNSIATVRNGLQVSYAKVDLTAQTAAIAATTAYAVPASGVGMYRVCWVATVTTAATTSSILGGTNGFQVTYTDADDSVVKTSVAANSITSVANTTGTSISGALVVYAKASTNIQYTFDYTSVGATPMGYNLHITVSKI